MKNGKLTIFENAGEGFHITFKKEGPAEAKDKAQKRSRKPSKKLLELLKENPAMTQKQMVGRLQSSVEGSKYSLRRL